jgi:hypothetical protein
MVKFICVCKDIIHTSGPIPNTAEWLTISDEEYDKFYGMIDAEKLYLAMKHVFRCPNCDRIWVFWDGMGEKPSLYTPTELDFWEID